MGKTLGYGEITVANMTEPFTVMLTNEAQQFATDSNRKVTSAQSYYTDIIVIRGSQERTDYTIGNITSGSGITVSKTSKRITFSVSVGSVIGADTGVIEIPITLDGQTVKKQFSWSCGKQGPQGVKGQDGTSIKITSKSVTYQTSTSGTTAPTGTWSTTVPTVNNGQYLWTKTTVQYSDGNKTEAYSVSYKGTNGTNGTSITVSKTEVTYQVSTSGTTAPTGTWSTTMPSCDQGQYLWTKTYVKYSDGKDTTSYSVSYKGVDGEKFAFNMLRETNQGSKHWVNMGASGKYSVESITTEDSINAVKLICTEPIASNEWQFCDFSDYEMLKSLKASTTYTLSYDIKTNRSGKILHNIKTGGGQKMFFANDIACKVLGNETWEHVSLKMTSGTTLPNLDGQVIYMFGDALSKVGYSIIKNLKLTEGIVDTPWAPHPEDLEGRGVTEITQWYLATNLSSGVTAGTSGWSTDITTQKITTDKKYLWNCHRTKYSDGTMTLISTPAIIGVYGDKGDNAKNLSITPSSQYFKSTDGGKTFAPNTITIKPTIQGEINFGKWQYSIDGGVSFADVVSGQKGLTISNNVLTVSKDSSLYSDAVTMITFRAVADDSSFYDTCSITKIYDVSDIGDGRNLLWNSNFAKTDEAITGTTNSWGLHTRGTNLVASIDTSTKHNGFNTLKTVSAANGDKNSSNDLEWFAWGISERTSDNLHSKNQNYTLSFYAKASVTTDFIVRWGYDAYGADTTRTLTTNWQKYEIKLHQATSAYSITIIFKLLTAGTVWFSEFKLEKGSSATGYSTAPEDLQTAILSTKSEISDVSLKVDKNKQAIEQRVEKTTYQQDLNLVKGDISKANEGLNKWRYEIYPKSLFASEYQGKSTMDVFAKNTNLTPSQSVLINDMDLSIAWNYDNNYIGYALTFAKFSAAKSVAITFAHDDGAHIYLNGKLIGGSDAYSQTGESLTLGFVKGWNCIEVVVNEGASTEGFKLGTTISAISECQLMNCYYGTPVARQSHITNQLVQNTTDIDGVSGSVQKVMSTVGGSGKIDEFVNNYSTWKKKVDGIETRVGETYTTKSDFNGLEIGGRNLLTKDDCNMSKWQNLYPAHCKVTNNDYSNHIDYVPTGGEWEIIYKKISVTKGQKYILSFDYKVNKAYNYLSGQKYGVYLSTSVPTNAAPTNIITDGQYAIENTVISIKRGVITFTAPIDTLYIAINGGCIDDNQTGLSFEFNKWKLEKGNKATDWTPASEDNKINGQNLVSNLPTNWEQGSVQCNTGSIYSGIKTATTTRLRVKDVFSVSGNVTISAGTSTNPSKEDLNFYYVLFDVNKKEISNSSTWQSLTSAKIINCGDAKYMAIILRWGSATTMMNPSDISQICLKIERGTSATPFTLAPEDVNGKIVNVETIANQTANKFEWIVKGGDSSSNFTLTDRVADLVAERINFKGLVTFSGLSTDAKNEIGKVAQSKVDGLEVGGRNLIINSNLSRTLTNVTNDGCSNMTVVSDSVYGHALKFTAVNQRRVFWATSNVWVKDKTYTVSFVAKSSVTGQKIRPSRSTADWGDDITLTTSYARYTTKITSLDTNAGGTLSFSCTNAVGDITITNVKLEVGNKATDWTPAPEDVSQDATNKASQALTDAKNYSSNAVNWVTNNGSSTTSLNSMVKKWTDGAVSDTTQINGGWIKANTITASKIAVGDFTNYADINESNTYGFSVEKTTDGVWFSKDGSKLTRDNYISKMYSCEPGQTFYVEYDISNTIKDSTEYKAAGIMLFGCDGTQTVKWYQRRGAVVGTAAGTVTHMSQQLTMPSGTRFFYVVLQIEGFQPFTGTLKIRNLSVRKAVTGAVIVDGSITADKIATDAIKSRNYDSSGGTQGSFLNLSDGSFTSPNLSWDANGNLIAKNANLSGQITATKGTVGGWNIKDSLYSNVGEPYDINKYYAKKILNKPSFTNIYMSTNILSAANYETVSGDHVTVGDSIIATNTAYSFGVNISLGRISLFGSTYYTSDLASELNKSSSLTLSGDKISFWEYDEDGYEISEQNNTYITSNYARFSGDIFIDGGIGTDGDVDVGGKLKASSIAAKNGGLIETAGTVYGGGEIQCGGGQMRIIGGDYGILLRNDGSDFYILSTDSGNQYGYWNSKRPFRINLANGIPYFEYGIIIPNENYLLGNGYQMCRGTSWGGVCIGDDSKGLRFYGTSIWASHSISTSDENLKENFTTLDQYEDFYMNLNPIGFNYIGDYDGKKTHFGFGAHKTEDILESEGYDSDKFAVVTHRPLVQEDIEKRFGKDIDVDIETEYGISYTEFIALNTHMIQKTRKELETLKQEKADLESRLAELEEKFAKLNL